MMLETTKLFTLIPVQMTLMFNLGHRVMGNLELLQSVLTFVKLHEATRMFVM